MFGSKIGPHAGSRVTPRIGSPRGAAATWPEDATSGIAVPASAAELNALLAAAGWTGMSGVALYLFGAAGSGVVADEIGSRDLTVSGTMARAQVATGWTMPSMRTTNATTGKAINSTLANINATDYTVLLWARPAAFTGGVTRTLMRMGDTFNDDSTFEIINSTTNRPQVGEGNGSRSIGTGTVSGASHAFVLRSSFTNLLVDGFTETEKITGGPLTSNGTELCFGGDNVQTWMPAGVDYIWGAVVGGGTPTDTQVTDLLTLAGW